MMARPMPFKAVPCSVWIPIRGERDAYGNETVTYAEGADIETTCCYAPGWSTSDTHDHFAGGHPHGDRATLMLFFRKDLDADLRSARVMVDAPDDATLASRAFVVVGEPYSYPRASTPGDYSWCVQAVANDG